MLYLLQYTFNKVYPKLTINFFSDLCFHRHTHNSLPKKQASLLILLFSKEKLFQLVKKMKK